MRTYCIKPEMATDRERWSVIALIMITVEFSCNIYTVLCDQSMWLATGKNG